MKNKYVYIKQGEYRANLFNDLQQVVNNKPIKKVGQPLFEEQEQVGFFTRMDYTLRLVRNTSKVQPELPLAISTYTADLTDVDVDPNQFTPIDINTLISALDEGYDYALFAFYSPDTVYPDYGLITKAKVIVRDPDTRALVTYPEGEKVIDADDNDNITNMTCFFGMVKAGSLPFYYMVLDNSLVHISDSLDITDEDNNVVFHPILDHEGTIKNSIFKPKVVEKTATVIKDSIIYTTDNTVTFEFFNDKQTFKMLKDTPRVLPKVNIDSTFKHSTTGKKIKFDISDNIGYIKITFDLGPAFRAFDTNEAPFFEFMVFKNSGE